MGDKVEQTWPQALYAMHASCRLATVSYDATRAGYEHTPTNTKHFLQFILFDCFEQVSAYLHIKKGGTAALAFDLKTKSDYLAASMPPQQHSWSFKVCQMMYS